LLRYTCFIKISNNINPEPVFLTLEKIDTTNVVNTNLISETYLLNFFTDLKIVEKNYNDDCYDTFDPVSEYNYLRTSSFVKFFTSHLIDTPVCFNSTKSLKRKNFELFFFKFISILSKNGFKEKVLTVFSSSFRNFLIRTKTDKAQQISNVNYPWLQFWIFINLIFDSKKNVKSLNVEFNDLQESIFSEICSPNKLINSTFFLKNYLFTQIVKLSPVFSYFIYSVDKNVRKYSRGKSGKYTFVWKYIPIYKRPYVALRWVLKDIKFLNNHTFKARLMSFFFNLFLNFDKTFAYKSKVFSHNYVFRNLRKSLMLSLRSNR